MLSLQTPAQPGRKRLPQPQWTVGFSADGAAEPTRFVPASVPGAVQLDWARAEGWQPHWQADNWQQYGWMEDVHWLYRTELPPTPLAPGHRVWLVLRGVDYRFAVRINGETQLEQEGMFRGVELDVTTFAATGARLEVAVWPAPKYERAHRPKAEASRSCKPAVSYGWDFHPRLIPLGVWDEAYLEVRAPAYVRHAELQYKLSSDLRTADLTAAIETNAAEGGWVHWTLHAPDGPAILHQRVPVTGPTTTMTFRVDDVQLWWPSGEGQQSLYESEFVLEAPSGLLVDVSRRRHGFRRVRLVMWEGAWNEPSTFPKGRTDPPTTFEVNGRKIFARGSNWVAPDIFPGSIDADTYEPLLQLAHAAHFNILRCWGGAIVNKESFFDRCDALGLMIWQEFPLACNEYADDDAYLQTLDVESRAIIRRLNQHPCLALWCGGNELFNVWSGMTDQHLALRLLNRNCLELDPRTPFLPTSPVNGMGHGDYRFRDDRGREVFQIFAQADNTAYTEFGCPGPASVATLHSFLPVEQRWPPRRQTSWETHHAFGAWMVAPTSWLFQDLIEEYFGPCESVERLVDLGQLMQAEGYKCLYEEARRQKPKSAMALCWCFNEPWPTAANNSLISWPHEPKPAYHAVALSCRPTLASAKIPGFSWQAGDVLQFDVWMLHDAPVKVPAGQLHVSVTVGGLRHELLQWGFPDLPAGENLAGPTVRFVLPEQVPGTFTINLQVPGRPNFDSRYELCYRQRQRVKPVFVLPGGDNNA